MLDDIELEELEWEYFKMLKLYLKQDFTHILEGLDSRLKIKENWYENFIQTARKGYKASDLDTGAERIFHHFFAPIFKFPNSAPVGADLMYELPEAILHVDIKTALIDNPADYKGKINVATNQTSYGKKANIRTNLPEYYLKNKPCLTYAIQIIHEHAKPGIKALILISIPNGQLFSIYGKSVIKSGKGGYEKGRDFRYHYAEEPYFKLLKEKYKKDIFRIEFLYLDKDLLSKKIAVFDNAPIWKQTQD
ncbi:hypothetical protein AUJ66_03645 [Candidatus Desantisbacteria bacterium CG1_02_38_46]|uniref:Restriction endonuclease n=3 Tax=unclassified Candidatus Desantisiibacteriota TaxID=3106372 RepID=A0A2H9PBL9_9BACT|nr:MAG: hypothetical protein AUJ66_03645 [Candidatus Desantisbacteria bacterium CG1_02_38_46]PIU51397.1 MAG: hypothetical protein COS91_04635 [Candidatus Desantisbacteria bacterium CG07_land_8_20_14_0_80_39_15]PIZ16296.1 MAG: hypothetical protein COY51_03060 [Candidatus Desantisbacteria bacterium CG_4_10_14_0_8_um_filter_39_17]